MIDGNPTTTNALLAVIAAVSVLQALVLLAATVLGYGLYRRTMRALRDIEEQQIAKRVQMLIARLDAVLADIEDVTGRVTRGTERLNATAGRMRASVRSRVSQVAGFVHALRSAAGHFLAAGSPTRTRARWGANGDRRTHESRTTSGV